MLRKAWRYRVRLADALREGGIALVELLLDLVEDPLFVFGERHRHTPCTRYGMRRPDASSHTLGGATTRGRVVARRRVTAPERDSSRRSGLPAPRPGPTAGGPGGSAGGRRARRRLAGPMASAPNRGRTRRPPGWPRPTDRASSSSRRAGGPAGRPPGWTPPRRGAGRRAPGRRRRAAPGPTAAMAGPVSTGSGTVTDRVMVAKSPKRTLSVTVRPARPCAPEARPPPRRPCARPRGRARPRVVRGRGRRSARGRPTSAARSGSTGRVVDGVGQLVEVAAVGLPEGVRRAAASGRAARSPTVTTPRRCSRSQRGRPDAPQRLDRQRVEEGQLLARAPRRRRRRRAHARRRRRRLGRLRRQLGQQLHRRHPDRARQAQLVGDPPADRRRRSRRRSRTAAGRR